MLEILTVLPEEVCCLKYYYTVLVFHEWEGHMGKYFVQGHGI